MICWKMESAMRSLMSIFDFHAPLPWVLPMESRTPLISA